MRKFKLIITLVLIFSMVFSIVVIPSHATAESVTATFFNWLLGYAGDKVGSSFLDGLVDAFGNMELSDHLHKWQDIGLSSAPSDDPWADTVVYRSYQCAVCGAIISPGAPDIADAYDAYVDDLPATGYNSDGHLIWQGTVDDCSSGSSFSFLVGGANMSLHNVLEETNSLNNILSRYSISIHPGRHGFRADYAVSSKPSPYRDNFRFNFRLYVPVDGLYRRLESPVYNGSVRVESGASQAVYLSYSAESVFSSYLARSQNLSLLSDSDIAVLASSTYVEYSAPGAFKPQAVSGLLSAVVDYYFPVYEVIPSVGVGDTYNINTRTTNIYGDLAYYDVSGTLQLVPDITIVNEGAKTYYNPVTNTTYEVNNWTYDYSDRSYTLNLNAGSTTTVIFGDEYIMIQEGDDVYYVYYVTNNTQPPETHTHEWYQTGASKATCTEYGTITYTCYTCNEQKTDFLPALGHDWVQSGYVDASYDDEGELLEKAHILYICSRCSEEYKDYDGVGPPDPPPDDDDDDSGGILAWLKEFKVWLGEKLDNLTGGGGEVNIDNDYNFTYTDENGDEHDSNIRDIIGVFDWWRDVADIGHIFVEQVSASEVAAYAYAADPSGGNPSGAPSIPINLSLAQSYYGVDYGGEVEMLDLSWYTPYKSTVDTLISGFMWLAFVWALFRRAPSIISGAGLTVNRSEDISDGHKGRK